MRFFALLFVVVAGVQVSKDYIIQPGTQLYQDAWTNTEITILIRPTTIEFHSLIDNNDIIVPYLQNPVCATIDGHLWCIQPPPIILM